MDLPEVRLSQVSVKDLIRLARIGESDGELKSPSRGMDISTARLTTKSLANVSNDLDTILSRPLPARLADISAFSHRADSAR